MTESELISIDKSISLTCRCHRPVGFIRTSSCNFDDWREIEGYKLPCHQWECEDCAKYLKNKLLDRITLGLEGIPDFYFMTLTSSFRNMDIKGAFHRFTSNMRHKFPIGRYVWIMELTPPSHEFTDYKGVTKRSVGGLRHFHVLISFTGDIPSKDEISDIWYKATKGHAWQVHFEELYDIRRPAGYISKYLTKALNTGYLYNEKRIGFSKGFPKQENNLVPVKGTYLSYDPRHEPDFSLNEESKRAFESKEQEFLRLTTRRKKR